MPILLLRVNRSASTVDCLILGGGLQGSCLALALAADGVNSTIIESRPEVMSGASLVNEGKIHMGFVYAMDKGKRTRELMLRGALSFAPLLDQWCGPLPWQSMVSDPFQYAVMPDSLLPAREVERSYRELEDLMQALALPRNHYLGHSLGELFEAAEPALSFPREGGDMAAAVYQTSERSVDPRQLAGHVRKALDGNPRIELRCNTRVTDAWLEDSKVALELSGPNGSEMLHARRVLNSTWESREGLDRTVGLPPQSLNYRVKHQVIVQPVSDARMPAPTTMVQGPYGDIVPWPNGQVYLSWYPSGRTYFGSSPPAELPGPDARERLAQETLKTFCEFYPSLNGAEIISCEAGIIVARGARDVDSPNSGLHTRHQVGSRQFGPWTSVDPGKLTTAPYIASQVVEELMGSVQTP